MQLDTITHMNALDYLRTLPDNSVHCCVTSPPYYGLRDYSADGQIGLEDTPAAFVANLVEVFEEVRRVLRDDGVCFVNLGDSYASQGGPEPAQTKWNIEGASNTQNKGRSRTSGHLKPKDLIGIPWRVAFALQDAGWWLRSDIIWHKPNPMPESVTDRPTKAHEYVFLLTKSAKYWYDADAIREPSIEGTDLGLLRGKNAGKNDLVAWHAPSIAKRQQAGVNSRTAGSGRRNKRTVWTVATEPSSLKHFAMFPQALIEPMILAGCPATVCSECGAGYVRDVERGPQMPRDRTKNEGLPDNMNAHGIRELSGSSHAKWRQSNPDKFLGFSPACTCNADQDAGIVIDPFMGTGTTAIVAQKHNRHWLGCDVNAETVELANERTRYHGDDKRMLKEQGAGVQQLDMFNE